MAPPEYSFESHPEPEAGVSLAAALEDHLHSRTLNLPLSRASAAEIREAALNGRRNDEGALVEAVCGDPATLATILREANRQDFDALAPVLMPGDAVARLGCERGCETLEVLVADAEFDRADTSTACALDRVRRRARAIALLAGEIMSSVSERHVAEARILGVLSEVGAVFLLSGLRSISDTRREAVPITPSAHDEILRELQDRYTRRLMAAWNLPPEAIAILEDRADGRIDRQLSLALRLARALVSSIGLPPIGCELAPVDEQDELWDLADMLELRYVDIAALQVRAEMLNDSLAADSGEGG